MASNNCKVNDKIKMMAADIENDVATLSELRKIKSSLDSVPEKCDVNSIPMGELTLRIETLEKVLHETKTTLDSVIADEIQRRHLTTLETSFFMRIEELGYDVDTIKELMSHKGVCAMGDIVTQVLLGEKWDPNALTFVNLKCNMQEIISVLKDKGYIHYHRDFAIPVKDLPSSITHQTVPVGWSCEKFSFSGDGKYRWILVFTSDKEEDVELEDAARLIPFDFLKTFYDANDALFYVDKWTNFVKRQTHWTNKSLDVTRYNKRFWFGNLPSRDDDKFDRARFDSSCTVKLVKDITFNNLKKMNEIEDASFANKLNEMNEAKMAKEDVKVNVDFDVFTSSTSSPSTSSPSSTISTISTISTLGEEFKKRVIELGVDYSKVEKLLSVKGMHAMGSIVTQVLLGEKWDTKIVEFVALNGTPLNIIEKIFGEKDRIGSPIAVVAEDRWKGTKYRVDWSPIPIVVYYSTDLHPTLHMARERLVLLDFLKTFYDGRRFVVSYPESLEKRVHMCMGKPNFNESSSIAPYIQFGFKLDEGAPRETNGYHLGSNTRSDYLTNPDPSSSSAPNSSASSTSTLESEFKKMVNELGIDYAYVERLLKVDGIYAMGNVVTQALLGEKWGTKVVAFVALNGISSALEFLGKKEYDLVPEDHEWMGTKYIAEWSPIPIVVYYPRHRGQLNFKSAYSLASLDFLKTFYRDGWFFIAYPESLEKRVHMCMNLPNLQASMNIAPYVQFGFKLVAGANRETTGLKLKSSVKSDRFKVEVQVSSSPSQVPSTSQVHSKLTIGMAIEGRATELGIDYAELYKILRHNACISITGDLLAQVLLGEKWDVDALELVSISPLEFLDQTRPILPTQRTLIDVRKFDKIDCVRYEFTLPWCPIPIKLTAPAIRPGETPKAYRTRVPNVNFEDIDYVCLADFLKNFYNTYSVVMTSGGYLEEKKSSSRTFDEIETKYTHLGFKFGIEVSKKLHRRSFLSTDDADIISKTLKKMCVASVSNTMECAFASNLARIGVNGEMIDHILRNRLGVAGGSIVLQSILGESWSNSTTLTLFETSYDALRRVLQTYGYKYIGAPHAHVNVYTKSLNKYNAPDATVDIATIRVVVHNQGKGLEELDHADATYDGKRFGTHDTIYTRVHRTKDHQHQPTIDKYIARGFTLAPLTTEPPKVLYSLPTSSTFKSSK